MILLRARDFLLSMLLKRKKEMDALETEEFNRAQKAVLRNPAIWILALSSAFMYISRYAVNSWGVFLSAG